MPGIATTRPKTVVNKVSQIPPAKSAGLGDPSNAGLKAAYLLTALWPVLLLPVILAIRIPDPAGVPSGK